MFEDQMDSYDMIMLSDTDTKRLSYDYTESQLDYISIQLDEQEEAV